MGDEPTITERQRKWFASVREGLARDTGRSFEDWVAIARACPETRPRARLQWLKDTHGLGMNRASMVLAEAFPAAAGWDDPKAVLAKLWPAPGARALYDAVEAQVRRLPEVTVGPRKSYVGFSHKVQFAAVRPLKAGGALLGLKAPLDADPRLRPRGRESWAERLQTSLALAAPDEIDDRVEALLRLAWRAA